MILGQTRSTQFAKPGILAAQVPVQLPKQPLGEFFEKSEAAPPAPYRRHGMSTTEKVVSVAGLAAGGAASGAFAGLMTMSNASQLSALPYFALAGGLCGCALAGVMIVGES
jgi:hypothetical protein